MMPEAISSFLQDDWRKVLLIKGEWGTGKTHFIKWTMLNDAYSSGFSHAYTSIAGIKSVEDLKRRILANIIVSKNGTLSTIENKVRPLLWALIENIDDMQNLLPKRFKPIDLTKIANSLINPSYKYYNFVVIIDDLEKCKLNDSNELYAFISFIKESTGCKIILIGNDSVKDSEKTTGGNAPFNEPNRFIMELKTSDEWKHKIIDQELDFKLSNEDIAKMFTKNEAIKSQLLKFLDVYRFRDLRRIRKAIATAEYISDFADSDQKIIAGTTSFDIAINSLAGNESKSPLPSVFNTDQAIILAVQMILSKGYLTEGERSNLIQGFRELKKRKKSIAQMEKLSEVIDLHFFSFSPRCDLENKLLAALSDTEDLIFVEICKIKIFADANGYTSDPISKKFHDILSKKAERLSESDFSNLTKGAIMDARIASLAKQYYVRKTVIPISEIIEKFNDNQMLYLDAIQYLPMPASINEFKQVIHRNNYHIPKTIYRDLVHLPDYIASRTVFDAILSAIEGENAENAERISAIRMQD